MRAKGDPLKDGAGGDRSERGLGLKRGRCNSVQIELLRTRVVSSSCLSPEASGVVVVCKSGVSIKGKYGETEMVGESRVGEGGTTEYADATMLGGATPLVKMRVYINESGTKVVAAGMELQPSANGLWAVRVQEGVFL